MEEIVTSKIIVDCWDFVLSGETINLEKIPVRCNVNDKDIMAYGRVIRQATLEEYIQQTKDLGIWKEGKFAPKHGTILSC